ncbi:hypothetical protein KUTeg_006091 [Tegillarca granosa]|uniref:Intraflagellar transport protein 57 homolog n=1 Tax=Tegillarca granosa TaxID=220873 RepID=A0ABQ9FJH1_TEGGR|nr:hypothetical protein KUTeg_006091 [Tegillarca granosa]
MEHSVVSHIPDQICIMSEDKRRGDDVEDGGPGLVYMPFVIMEELLDKLRLLDYERDFSRKMNMKPISRHYFAIPTNPGEQFYMFSSLAAWLLRLAGRNFEQPQEYDDPNATVSSILDEVKKFGHSIDFPPSRLKQGCGEHCIYVLDRLSDEALKHTGFRWNRPDYPEEELDEEQVIEDDSELTLGEVEKTMMQIQEGSKPEEILESTTDAADWKLEVERVLPQLKVTIRPDNKDWRIHVDQMHQHKDGIESALTETPLVKIKQAIQQLKKENQQNDIRIGVVEHVLLQAKLKDKTSQNKQAHSSGPNQDTFDYSAY